MRGGKASLFDGGTRVPFIVSQPGHIKSGESDALVSHVDFYASFAAMTGHALSKDEAPDSFDVLNALTGKSAYGRNELVVEGTQAKTVLRQDNWTFIPPYDGPKINVKNLETGNSSENQLYDLSQDIGQIRNLAKERTDIVRKMSDRLRSIRASASTRPLR